MALYRDIQFNKGTVTDLMGATGTVTGATFNKDKKGWALHTGVGKYVQYDKQLLPDGAFSVVAWVKCDKIDLVSRILPLIANNTFGAYGIILNSNYNGSISRPMLWLGANNFKYFYYVLDTKWHCFIFTIDGGLQTSISSAKMYVDNIEKAQMAAAITSGTPNARNTFLYLGGASAGANPIGKYDARLKVYDHVLTSKEREREQVEFEAAQPLTYQKRLLSLPKPTELKQSGLIAKYNMKPVGGILHDISGNGKHITVPVGGYITTAKGLRGYNKNIGLSTYNLIPTTLSCTDFTYCLAHDGMVFPSATLFHKIKYIGVSNTTLKYFETPTFTDFTPSIPVAQLTSNGTIIFTYTNSTKTLTVTINGVFAGSCVFATAIGTTSFESILNVGNYAGKQINGTIKDITIYNKVISTPEIKQYHNQFNEVILHEKFEDMAVGSAKLPNGWIKNGGSFVCGESTTNDAVIKSIRKGTKYLRCVTAGIVAIPSKWVNGTMEFSLYKNTLNNTTQIGLISDIIKLGVWNGFGYMFWFYQNNSISMYRINNTGGTNVITTSPNYISNNTWYRIRITRTTSGTFTIYILGGNFTSWTLVGDTNKDGVMNNQDAQWGSGSNPVSDTTYNSSSYFVIDLDANDRVSDILIQNQIKA